MADRAPVGPRRMVRMDPMSGGDDKRSPCAEYAPTATVVRGDVMRLPLRDASVDLIVTSPPYFGQRSYKDGGEHYDGQVGDEGTVAEFLWALWNATGEMVRVLKPTGSIFVNLGDKYVADNRGSGPDGKRGDAKHSPAGPGGFVGREVARKKSLLGIPWRYANGCVDQLDLILRAEIIWSKANGLPEGQVRDRVQRQHEQWFHFTKEPAYFCSIDDVREPHDPWTLKAYEYEHNGYERRNNGDRSDRGGFAKPPVVNPLGKVPGSVWRVNSEPLKVPAGLDVDHFAAFPQEFPRRFVLGWSPPGGVVLDPFAGTGTTVGVARALGRTGIGVELSLDYCRLANWFLRDGHRYAKASSRTDAERQTSLALGGVS